MSVQQISSFHFHFISFIANSDISSSTNVNITNAIFTTFIVINNST